jgi:hypothetical protein
MLSACATRAARALAHHTVHEPPERLVDHARRILPRKQRLDAKRASSREEERIEEIEPREERCRGQPGRPPGPAGHVGRLEQGLPHRSPESERRPEIRLQLQSSHRADHELDRALDLRPVGSLRIELCALQDGPNNFADVVAAPVPNLSQPRHGFGPRVGVRELPEEPDRDEPRRRIMRHDDVDNLIAPERPGLPQECLHPAVLEAGLDDKLRLVRLRRRVLCRPAFRLARTLRELHPRRRRQPPAGEGPRRLPHILLGVVAHPHREQLHQLPRVVLIRVGRRGLNGVEIDHHGRVAADGPKQVVIPRQRHAPEQLILDKHEFGPGDAELPEL